jgi:hypothetical protein
MELLIYLIWFVLVGGAASVFTACASRAARRTHRLPSWWIAIAASLFTTLLVIGIAFCAELIVPGSWGKGTPETTFLSKALFIVRWAVPFSLPPAVLVVLRYRTRHDHAA